MLQDEQHFVLCAEGRDGISSDKATKGWARPCKWLPSSRWRERHTARYNSECHVHSSAKRAQTCSFYLLLLSWLRWQQSTLTACLPWWFAGCKKCGHCQVRLSSTI